MTQKQMGRPPARRLWRNVWLAGTLGPVLAVTAWSGAHAVTILPDAFASGAINLQHSSFCGAACSIQPTLGDFGNVTGLGDVAGANATATIGAAMSAFTVSSSFDVDPGWTAGANVTAVYSFEWVGPTSSTTIDTDIAVLVHTEVDAGATEARAHLTILDESTHALVFNDSWGCAFNGCANPDFNGTLQLSLSPNVVYDVSMTTQLISHVPFGGGAASAFMDPHIFQDPIGIDPSYALALSAGVGNTVGPSGGVPEPAAWAMLTLGFGAVGRLARRRRLAPAMA